MSDLRERLRCQNCGRQIIAAAWWGELTRETARQSRWCDPCAYPRHLLAGVIADRLRDAIEREARVPTESPAWVP